MQILTQKDGGNYIIKLRGELDASNAETVEKMLDEVVKLEPEQIQIDCKELKYISSRGLGVFISRFQEINNRKIGFFLYNMNDHVKYVFKVLGLDDIMDLRSGKKLTS